MEVHEVEHGAFVEAGLRYKLEDVHFVFDLVGSILDDLTKLVCSARKEIGHEGFNCKNNSVLDRACDPHLILDVFFGLTYQVAWVFATEP